MTAKYERLAAVAKERYNEKGFCCPLAIAVVGDLSMGKALAAMRRAGRKDKKPSSGMQVRRALEELGISETYTDLKGPHSITVARFEKTIGAEGRHIAFTHQPRHRLY